MNPTEYNTELGPYYFSYLEDKKYPHNTVMPPQKCPTCGGEVVHGSIQICPTSGMDDAYNERWGV